MEQTYDNISEKVSQFRWILNLWISSPPCPSLLLEPLGRVSIYSRYIYMYVSRALDKFAVSTRRLQRRQNVVRFCFHSANLWIFRLRPNAFPSARSRALLYYIIPSVRDDSRGSCWQQVRNISLREPRAELYIYIFTAIAMTIHYTIYYDIIYNTRLCTRCYNIPTRAYGGGGGGGDLFHPPLFTPHHSRPIEAHRFSASEPLRPKELRLIVYRIILGRDDNKKKKNNKEKKTTRLDYLRSQ